MKIHRVWWLCLTLACAYETPHSQQASVLARLTPETLAPPTPALPEEKVRTVKVIAVVDDDSRTESRDFDSRIRQQFALASAAAHDVLGIRFEIISMRDWPHRAGTEPLGRSLEALQTFEPGDGADLVVGFVSSLPVIEASQDQVGLGQMLSKHVVLRGWNDGLQMVSLLNDLRALGDDEKVEFVRKRRAHQLTVLLLHEWAHTLGVPHEHDEHSIMNPQYSRAANGFTKDSLAMMRVALDARRKGLSQADQAKQVRAVFERLDAIHFYEAERREWLASLEELEKGTGRSETGVALVFQLFNDRKYAEAKLALAPLLEKSPADGNVRTMNCQLAQALAAPDAVKTCAADVVASPRSARVKIAQAQALLMAKQTQAAADLLFAAQQQLDAGGADDAVVAWQVLAQTARKASCVALAAIAAEKAHDPAVAAWANSTTRWMSLTATPGVCEFEFIEHFRNAENLFDHHQFDDAQKEIDWFSSSGGAQAALRCELELHRENVERARRECQKAVIASPQSTAGHYFLAVTSELDHHPNEVVSHLEKALDLDPTIDDAYGRLAAAYESLGRVGDVEHVARRFQKQFGKPMKRGRQ